MQEKQIAIDPALEFHLRLIARAKELTAEEAMREALTRYRDDYEPLAKFLREVRGLYAAHIVPESKPPIEFNGMPIIQIEGTQGIGLVRSGDPKAAASSAVRAGAQKEE